LVPARAQGRWRSRVRTVWPRCDQRRSLRDPQDHARHRLLRITRNATLSTLPADAMAPRELLKPVSELARVVPMPPMR